MVFVAWHERWISTVRGLKRKKRGKFDQINVFYMGYKCVCGSSSATGYSRTLFFKMYRSCLLYCQQWHILAMDIRALLGLLPRVAIIQQDSTRGVYA